MSTLFDLSDIPEKQPDSTPAYEYVITFTDTDSVQWFYVSGIESEQGLQWVKREDRKLPKRYKTISAAHVVSKKLNEIRKPKSVEAGIFARVIVWNKP